MAFFELENQNPNVYNKSDERRTTSFEEDDSVVDDFDSREIFDLIRTINDPEHPLTLEQLHVVQEDHIAIDNAKSTIDVNFTPTIPHCSMANLIGLSIKVKLLRCLPPRFKKFLESMKLLELIKGKHSSRSHIETVKRIAVYRS